MVPDTDTSPVLVGQVPVGVLPVGVGVGDVVLVGVGLGVADLVGLGVGEAVVRVGLGVAVATPPVQVTPLSAKLLGAGFEELFQEPLKPNAVLAPVASDPL